MRIEIGEAAPLTANRALMSNDIAKRERAIVERLIIARPIGHVLQALVASGSLSLANLITHRRQAADAAGAYRTAFDREPGTPVALLVSQALLANNLGDFALAHEVCRLALPVARRARDARMLCVVEEVADLWALDRARLFPGRFHVLGGRLSALDGIGPEQLGIDALVAQGRVVLTTVGPYQLYGDTLINACARAGTHYADLCGEPAWLQTKIAAEDAAADAVSQQAATSLPSNEPVLKPDVWFVRSNKGSGSFPVTREGFGVVRNFIFALLGAGAMAIAVILERLATQWPEQ